MRAASLDPPDGPSETLPISTMIDFLQEATDLFSYTQSLRRDLHVHPELGFQEIRTAGVVARELEALGLEVTKGVGKTGVVALLESSKPGPTLLLRFDMDALPIVEDTGTEYASQNPGVTHACGHDGHTAIGLTVARILEKHRDDFSGTLKFCFQPSEEGLNGEECGGNEMMIRDGVLENPQVDKTLALHVWNDKSLGWVNVASGPVMAGAELFTVRLTGRGGHGAAPHLAVDPIVAAAQVVTALQAIVARNINPLEPAVVSVTTVHTGTAFNIIPQETELSGTVRTFSLSVRERVLERLTQTVSGIAEAMGCHAEINIKRLTPPVINDAAIASRVQERARSLLPDIELDATDHLTMGAEDMGYMQEKLPGCYFFLGSSNKDKQLDFPHHHPKFDFDEAVLPRAAALMAAAAVDLLR